MCDTNNDNNNKLMILLKSLQGHHKESKVSKTMLPRDFVPTPYCVICGKGKRCFSYVGNERWRVIVTTFLERYSMSKSKKEKSTIVKQIVHMIRQADGAFIRWNPSSGTWCEVGDAVAIEKTGALFRDLLHLQYRSASKSKLARRHAIERKRLLTSAGRDDSEPTRRESIEFDLDCFQERPASPIYGDCEPQYLFDNDLQL